MSSVVALNITDGVDVFNVGGLVIISLVKDYL